jgi:hypothetical protein
MLLLRTLLRGRIQRLCLLVIIGVTTEGQEEWVAISDGVLGFWGSLEHRYERDALYPSDARVGTAGAQSGTPPTFLAPAACLVSWSGKSLRCSKSAGADLSPKCRRAATETALRSPEDTPKEGSDPRRSGADHWIFVKPILRLSRTDTPWRDCCLTLLCRGIAYTRCFAPRK